MAHQFNTKVHCFSCKVHNFPEKVPLFLRNILANLRIAKHHHPTLRDTHIIFFDKTKAALHKLIKAYFFKQQLKGKMRTYTRTNSSKTNNYEQKSINKPRNTLTILPIQSNLHLFASTSPRHHPTTKKYPPPSLLRPSSLYPIVEFVHVQLCILCRNNYFCIQTHRCHGNTFSPRSPACSLITSALSR